MRDCLRIRAKNQPDEWTTFDTRAALGEALLRQEKYAEAETVLREGLAIYQKLAPDGWKTFNTRAMLGGSLLGQRKYAQAEPLLLDGYAGMKALQPKVQPHFAVHLTEALQRLVQLYDALEKPEQAAEWRKQLEAAKTPAPPKKP